MYRNRFLNAVITLLFMSVTALLMCWLDSNRNNEFFYTLSALLLGEFLLGFSNIFLSKGKGNLIGFTMIHSVVSIIYLVFTFAMLLVYHAGASEKTLQIAHLLGVLFMITAHIIVFMGRSSANEVESKQKAARANKERFFLEIAKFTSIKYNWMNDPEFARKINNIRELANHAPESIPGLEEADNNIIVALNELNNAPTQEAAAACADKLAALFDYRRDAALKLR